LVPPGHVAYLVRTTVREDLDLSPILRAIRKSAATRVRCTLSSPSTLVCDRGLLLASPLANEATARCRTRREGSTTAPQSQEGKTDVRQDAEHALVKAKASDLSVVQANQHAHGAAVVPNVGKGTVGVPQRRARDVRLAMTPLRRRGIPGSCAAVACASSTLRPRGSGARARGSRRVPSRSRSRRARARRRGRSAFRRRDAGGR